MSYLIGGMSEACYYGRLAQNFEFRLIVSIFSRPRAYLEVELDAIRRHDRLHDRYFVEPKGLTEKARVLTRVLFGAQDSTEIAAQTGLSTKTVSAYLSALEADGIIECVDTVRLNRAGRVTKIYKPCAASVDAPWGSESRLANSANPLEATSQ